MDSPVSDQSQWRGLLLALVVTGVVLGVEQVLPLSDSLRSQIGVLTVLLMSGLWHLVYGLLPGVKKE